ncbi:MAG TPA: hypothetical protein PLU71_04270 [Candidatus Dependentiae bacterium]|nr:hypothetical protein [Candidatus Dependentiae bacterium]HRQ63048.1 hypothetical protein [Candidatus Dependentiae bacterium]
MKLTNTLMLTTLALLSIGNTAFGHIYSFTNHTKKRVHVRVKLGGIGEPWYYVGKNPFQTKENTKNFIPAGESYELRFVLGEGPGDYSRKFGFCLAFIQYSPNGQTWSNVEPTFVESKTSNDLLSAATAFTKGATETAAAVLQNIPEVKKSSKDLADEAARELIEGKKSAEETKKSFHVSQLKGVAELPLDKIVSSIGTMIQKSMCRERHFDIIPNMVLEATTQETEKSGQITEMSVAEAIGQPLFITIAK